MELGEAVSGEAEEYSKLLERVLARFPDLSRDELEAMVEAKLRESRLLNKVGALLLVAEELGAFGDSGEAGEEPEVQSYVKLGRLIPGLRDVSVRGAIYAISKPAEAKDHKLMKLKIGDETGSINVILWDERVEEAVKLGLKLGDKIAILHGYTRERIDTGMPELHVGRNGVLARLEEEGADPRSFYLDLGEALERGRGVYDVRAMVLDPGEERRISTRYGEAEVREIRIIGETGGARLTVWRDRVGEFRDLKPGETIYVTDVRLEEGRASLTPRSILAIREEPSEESLRLVEERKARGLVVRVLDVVETGFGVTYIATDGDRIFRIRLSRGIGAAAGDHLRIREAIREDRRGRARLICGEEDLEKIEPEKPIQPPERRIRLREISTREGVELHDVVVEGVLYTKTKPIKVRTRFGEAEKVGFWLKDEDAAVQASAWREKAEEIAGISEGSRIRLKWVSVRTNVFGEPEIQLDADSVVEVLEESEERSKPSG